MKLRWYCFVLCSLVLVGTASAQITIVKADFDAAFINSTHFDISDSTDRVWDLGSPSASAQTFDFTWIPFAPATVDTDTTVFVTPAGRLRASDFPEATVCVEITQTQPGAITLTSTIAQYSSSETDGVYFLGMANRVQISPPFPPFPADTTVIVKYRPKALGVPLPLTRGTSRTSVDTLTQDNIFSGTSTTTITERSYTADAFGTLLLPGGVSKQVIRVIQDEVEITTPSIGPVAADGAAFERERTKEVNYIAQDGTSLEFDVDTSYTGSGATRLTNYSYDYRAGGPTSVREVSSGIPERTTLYANYPNPFNPSTSIRFDIREQETVSLVIYDILGREVVTLLSGTMNPGSYEIPWNAAGQPSGMYFLRFMTSISVQTQQLLLAK